MGRVSFVAAKVCGMMEQRREAESINPPLPDRGPGRPLGSSQEAVASWDQASSVSSQKVTPALDAEVVTSLAKAGLTQHLETFLAKAGLTQNLDALRGNGVGTMGILEYLDEADMRECGLELDQATLVRLMLPKLAAAAAEAQREKLERKPVRGKGKGNGKHRTCAEVPVLVLPLVFVLLLVIVLAVILILVLVFVLVLILVLAVVILFLLILIQY